MYMYVHEHIDLMPYAKLIINVILFSIDIRSKLASLFGGGSQGGNESLTYTAPKQPKKAGMFNVCYYRTQLN